MRARDGLSLFLDHQLLNREEQSSRFDDLGAGRLDDAPGLADPILFRLGFRVFDIDLLEHLLHTIVIHRDEFGPQVLLDLLRGAGGSGALRRAPCNNPRLLSQTGTRSNPTARSISDQSLLGNRITFLPCLCHCGRYIQPWPLKGGENKTGGQPEIDEFPQDRGVRHGRRGG